MLWWHLNNLIWNQATQSANTIADISTVSSGGTTITLESTARN